MLCMFSLFILSLRRKSRFTVLILGMKDQLSLRSWWGILPLSETRIMRYSWKLNHQCMDIHLMPFQFIHINRSCLLGSFGDVFLYVPNGEPQWHQHEPCSFLWAKPAAEKHRTREVGQGKNCVHPAIQQGQSPII